jgi:predicted dehydrogenase
MNKIKIGIFGAGRGTDMARHFEAQGCELVALCDVNERRIKEGFDRLGKEIPFYYDFDEFLKVDMDAVIIANYFHEHAPYTIKCFEKNIHVFCECISNGTMAEGIMLHDAFKKSKSIYFMAENYPQLVANREMKRVCENKSLGKILYAEGEYNHPSAVNDVSFLKEYNYFEKHWRNYLPATYYITHSLGPIMYCTGAIPKRVTGFAIFEPYEHDAPTAKQVADRTAIITTINSDNSVFRVTGCANFGGHHNSYRVCGTEGSIETVRGADEYISLRYNGWSIPEGLKETNFYKTEWNDSEEEKFKHYGGHGGADYLTVRMFLKCITDNKQPEYPFNLFGAITMSSVAILSHRSVLNGGQPFDIPNFENDDDRSLYENDFDSPFYDSNGNPPTIACCSANDYKANQKQIENYKKALKEVGIE